jgi:NADH-quinone oxidoreductase subunit J
VNEADAMTALFYLSAAVAVLATLAVITRKNAVHALLYLIVSLLAVAVIFFILGSPFVAALEVIIYAGAIMVLFLFAVMMLGAAPSEPAPKETRPRVPGWAGPAVLSLVLLVEFVIVLVSGGRHGLASGSISPQDAGLSLFSTYVFGVELAAAVLLAALIGAYHIGRKEEGRKAAPGQGVLS